MNQSITASFNEIVSQLAPLYGTSEAQSIVNILFEDLLAITRTDRLVNGNQEISDRQSKLLLSAIDRLLEHEPIQHIIGFAYFCGYQFKVTRDTLIPRPETEELVHLIISENKQCNKLVDIGTGTGCIPISLSRYLKNTEIHGWDISGEALTIARANAHNLQAKVAFTQMDALHLQSDEIFDIIVSNPPYIPNADKAEMSRNVLDYEPPLALFVDDQEPLIFYRKIAEFGRTNLSKTGKLYFEIHERLGDDTRSLLQELGYQNVTIIQDLNGKNRMIRADY